MPTDMTCRPFHTPDNKIEERGKDRVMIETTTK